MVHVFKRVSISDGEAEIRFFRVYALVNKNWTRN